jgi:hypothetical protein
MHFQETPIYENEMLSFNNKMTDNTTLSEQFQNPIDKS